MDIPEDGDAGPTYYVIPMPAINRGNTVKEQVWRYMSFSRFVWLLQKKQLWLSRADLLGDPWEITLAGNQLAHVIARHPPNDLTEEAPLETAMQRAERIIRLWRQKTFVNCWSSSKHESHALWRIYCRSHEGVAIQTTLSRLQQSVGQLGTYRVTYEEPGTRKVTPTIFDLVTKKRPMFAYEQEVRVVDVSRQNDAESTPETPPRGRGLNWNPEDHLESIWVHPDGDESFMQTVSEVVQHYAPRLGTHVSWSAMTARPPF